MAVEIKKGRPYLTRTWTAGGKTHSVYIGNHPVPLTGHLALQAMRLAHKREREDVAHLRRYLELADPYLGWLHAELRGFAAALLIALGFHYPEGEWRKKQGVSSWDDASAPFPEPIAPSDSLLSDPLISSCGPDALRPAHLSPTYPLHPMNNSHTSILQGLLEAGGIGADAQAFTSSADVQADETIIDFAAETLEPGHPLEAPMFEKPGAGPEDFGVDPKLFKSLQDEALHFAVMLKKAPPCQETADAVREALVLASDAPLGRAMTLLKWIAHVIATGVYMTNKVARYEMLTELDRKRIALGAPEALPHERPFIDQLALVQHMAELTLFAAGAMPKDMKNSPKVRDYWPKRIHETQAQLRRATQQLERVRRHTRQTKAVQGDLARYLERIAPPPEDRVTSKFLRWAPSKPPAPKQPDPEPAPKTREEIEQEAWESQVRFLRMAMEEALKREGITEWDDLEEAYEQLLQDKAST